MFNDNISAPESKRTWTGTSDIVWAELVTKLENWYVSSAIYCLSPDLLTRSHYTRTHTRTYMHTNRKLTQLCSAPQQQAALSLSLCVCVCVCVCERQSLHMNISALTQFPRARDVLSSPEETWCHIFQVVNWVTMHCDISTHFHLIHMQSGLHCVNQYCAGLLSDGYSVWTKRLQVTSIMLLL